MEKRKIAYQHVLQLSMKTESYMKWGIFGLLLILSAIMPITMNAEEKRYALIIGNSEYESGDWQPLKSPKQDAALMNAVFKRLGFDTFPWYNLKKDAMLGALEAFCKRLEKDDTVVFYYSGHGKNYCEDYVLVPVDSAAEKYGNDQKTVDANYVRLSEIAKIIRDKCGFSILFIDACRDGNSKGDAVKGRKQVDKQLDSTEEKAPGQYICYATQNGNTVSDKEKGNGDFAEVLSERLFDKNEDFIKVWERVKKEVDKKTGGTQVPADIIINGSSVHFCFNGENYLPLNKKYYIFETEPNNAEIILLKDSKNPKSSEKVYHSGQKYVFDSGESFNYDVKCSGYIPEKGTLKITDMKTALSVTRKFALKKSENAVMHIVSDKDRNAKVYWDGQYVGTAPCDIYTLTGPHDIRVKRKMYYDYSKRILLDSTDMYLPVALDYRTPSYFDWDEYAAHHVSYHFSPKYQASLSYMYRVDGYNVTRLSYGLILGFSPWFFKGMGDYFSQSVSVDVSSSTSVSTSVSVGGVPIVGESEAKKNYDTSSMEYSSFVDPYGIAKYYDSNALALANIGFNACNGIMLEVGIGAAWHQDKYYMENTYKVIETIKGEESPIYDYSPQNVSHLYKGKVKCSPAIRLGVNFMIPFNRDYDFGLTIGGGYIYLPMNHRSSSWDASLGFIWSY